MHCVQSDIHGPVTAGVRLYRYDGTLYATQCPIAVGQSFTYRFPVNEPVGTYLWHDHSQLYRADGLQGALIVLPREGGREAWDYDGDFTLLTGDWFHGQPFPGLMA